jgi:hypothetical protein
LRQSFSAVVFFAAIVLVAFILYMWTLQRKPASTSTLHRVQTMSYYMTDVGTEDIVRVDRSHYYTPLAVS